ncbi:hypothetical protein H112_05166 [Trichophyton rubrum D6]|uniref:AB hydrolase-1 domain-containing protein n=3 Tax=Trichophyton TaxID=5550 RepID=F2SLK4_TRIRC|nr:uncharacterized protein TERG_02917 [Trichophyton rubrum CBS 118892]EZF22009.1 hypothetical protein H100_05188 [Trichophyton rubrum MR850]EZF40891.1 hypothetical protein H102_05175 [Trichophyton rubrum CBS 100081]EZF51685.1 hypothetical protein H103_05176 [Trichophyton rubrum CBS 288.86]EZF62220.1 hypothetical protein H104_05169 [Trichophyton rubrum CBS 289.86]EZF72931.1 hypothetical protein H105_05196 [Trichophyton soudanense CBS 452.61]EZF83341.1 hypothetical protein H110_05175 [Trichophy
MTSCFRVIEHVVPCQHIREYPYATATSQEETLSLAVKQYAPLDNPNPQPGDVTIIGTHANGFPKELYEPLWEEVHARSKKAGFRIRSIWIADVAHQGQSGVLNEHSLGNDPSWYDNPRDLLHLINLKRDEMPRPIVGIGHSMGGNNLIFLSVMHPRLLTALILLDPVMNRLDVLDHEYSEQTKVNIPTMTLASTYRRDIWPSRIAAENALKGSKFYQNWDPRVLQRFFKYGLRELPTALYPLDDNSTNKPVGERPVTLTTTRHQEVLSFVRAAYGSKSEDGQTLNRTTHPDLDPATYKSSFPFYRYEVARTFELLPFVRPSVLYLFADQSEVSSPKMNQDKIEQTGIAVGGSGGVAEGRIRGIVMKGVGHLIAMEAVNRTAELCTDQISVEMHRWRREEEQLTTAWKKKSSVEKMTIDQEWVKQVDLLDVRNTRKKTNTDAKL